MGKRKTGDLAPGDMNNEISAGRCKRAEDLPRRGVRGPPSQMQRVHPRRRMEYIDATRDFVLQREIGGFLLMSTKTWTGDPMALH